MKLILENNDRKSSSEQRTPSFELKKTSQKIDKTISILPFKKTCLIRSMIKSEFFNTKFDYFLPVQIGISRDNELLLAHSWVEPDYMNSKNTYKKIF
jgi:hypothetical protein